MNLMMTQTDNYMNHLTEKEALYDQINRMYNLKIVHDCKIVFNGRVGKVTGVVGPYLKIKLDDKFNQLTVHPTWRMVYI